MIFFGGVLALAMASAHLLERKRSNANYFTAGFLCSIGIWQIYHGFMLSGFLFTHPHLALVHVPFLYLTAPLLYFYFQILTKDDFRCGLSSLRHFIPVMIIIAVLTPFYVKTGAEKLELLHSFVGLRGQSGVFSAYPYLVMIMLAAFCIYACAVIFDIVKIYRYRLLPEKDTTFYSIIIVAFNFLLMIVYISGFLVIKLFYSGTHYPVVIRSISVIMALEIYVILLLKWRYPNYISEIRAGAERIRYATSRIQRIDVEATLERLKDLMENQKVFCDEEISLSRLADELDITPCQLSQILNELLNKNFNTFINEYRVREAEIYLLGDPKRSVMSISFAVGFNTVSSFYNAFDRIHNMTPSQFRNHTRR